MNPRDTDRIRNEMLRLQASFPQRAIEPQTIAVYVDALADMNPDALHQAVELVMRSDDWFPTIKRLRTACEEFAFGQLSAADDRRWLERFINGIGAPYDPVTETVALPKSWPNPVMQEAVRLFGWKRFQDSNPEYLGRDWERTWNEARSLVLKRTANDGPSGDALKPGDEEPPMLKVVGR